MFNVGDTLLKLATESGFAGFFANGGWQNLVMIVIACVLLYLGIVKGFEPLLLVGIAFGCLLANVSYFPGLDAVNPELNATNAMYHPELWSAFLDSTSPYYHSYGHILSNAGLLDIFYIGVKAGLYPSLIFMARKAYCRHWNDAACAWARVVWAWTRTSCGTGCCRCCRTWCIWR